MANSETKWALVTGAGSGIGKASAISLNKSGFQVILVGRRESQIEQTLADFSNAGQSYATVCDVSDSQQVQELFGEIKSRVGRLDLLFNNAGISAPPLPLEEVEFEDWRKVIDINLSGMFYCLREAYRLMKEQDPQGGRIINNGSIAATTPRPNSIPYAATKHGVTGLTKSTSLEGRKYNIACGQIDIGNASTEMAAGVQSGVLQPGGNIQTEPVMDVQHVADAVVNMASLPLNANILFLTVMANAMPFVGRG